MPRQTSFIDGIATPTAATGTVTTTIRPPTWAVRGTINFATTIAGTGTGSCGISLLEVLPAFTAAPVIAVVTTGTGQTYEVDTITMTGEPDHGAFTIGVTGVGTTTVYTTPQIPLSEAKARAARITDHLIEAGLPNAADLKWTVALGTGASTPTVFTVTYSGTFTNTQAGKLAVDGSRLWKPTNTTLAFNGITQEAAVAATGTTYQQFRIGPGETGIADTTGTNFAHINAQLPEYLAVKIVTTATANMTVAYSAYVTWMS